MKVELLDHTPDPEYKIGLFAAECYDSKTDRESCIRRAKSCKDSGHLATLRFAYATFRVSGISRVCSHQLVRHAHLSYLQRSQRYCASGEDEIVHPPGFDDLPQDIKHNWLLNEHYSKELYQQAINAGMKKQDARFILTQGSSTSIVVTGNFQAWMDFINLRSDKHAQQEIRDVALAIKGQLWMIAPSIFG